MKYSITAEVGTKRQEIVDMVKDFAKIRKLVCDTKAKKLFDTQGKEVGSFNIGTRMI